MQRGSPLREKKQAAGVPRPFRISDTGNREVSHLSSRSRPRPRVRRRTDLPPQPKILTADDLDYSDGNDSSSACSNDSRSPIHDSPIPGCRFIPSFAIPNLKTRFERYGGRSSMVELQIVILAVAGSSPVGHPFRWEAVYLCQLIVRFPGSHFAKFRTIRAANGQSHAHLE